MLTNSPSTNFPSYRRFDRNPPTAPHASMLLRSERRPQVGEGQHDYADHWLRPLLDHRAPAALDRTVEIFPADAVKRRAVSWDGMTAEVVQATRSERTEYRYNGPRHLLAVYEQGERREGETLVEGLPRSTLRDFKRKLVFVPAGHEYSDWQEPRALTRVVYFYFDPAKMPTLSQTDVGGCAPEPATVLRRHDAMGYCDQAAQADRERRRRQSALFRGPWCRPGARARASQCRDPSGRSSRAGRPCGLAAADRHLVYRGTSRRADTARHACASRSPEPVLFLPRVQAISRDASPPISQQPAHRAGEDALGEA